jgi:hypothetical protein
MNAVGESPMSIHTTEIAEDARLVVSPKRAQHMLDIGNTKFYELLNSGELVSFKTGKSRKITVESIVKYIERQLAR